MEWLLHRASIPFFMLSVKNRCISLIICCTDRIPSGIASLARIISGCNQFLPATGERRLVFRRHLRDTRADGPVKLLCVRVEHVFSCHVRCAGPRQSLPRMMPVPRFLRYLPPRMPAPRCLRYLPSRMFPWCLCCLPPHLLPQLLPSRMFPWCPQHLPRPHPVSVILRRVHAPAKGWFRHL